MADDSTISHFEPLLFNQGDTLHFRKNLPNYLPADGWSLLYEIRGGTALTVPAISFTSTLVAPGNTEYDLTVPAATTIQWTPGPFILAGYAVNTSGERHQIYEGVIQITPNLGTQNNDVDLTTFSQKMVASLQAALISLNATSITASTIQQTQIIREKRSQIRTELAFWEERRRNEIALLNVRNGRPSGNRIRTQAAITTGGCAVGTPVRFPLTGAP